MSDALISKISAIHSEIKDLNFFIKNYDSAIDIFTNKLIPYIDFFSTIDRVLKYAEELNSLIKFKINYYIFEFIIFNIKSYDIIKKNFISFHNIKFPSVKILEERSKDSSKKNIKALEFSDCDEFFQEMNSLEVKYFLFDYYKYMYSNEYKLLKNSNMEFKEKLISSFKIKMDILNLIQVLRYRHVYGLKELKNFFYKYSSIGIKNFERLLELDTIDELVKKVFPVFRNTNIKFDSIEKVELILYDFYFKKINNLYYIAPDYSKFYIFMELKWNEVKLALSYIEAKTLELTTDEFKDFLMNG